MKNYFLMIIGAIAVALGITPAADAAKPVDIGLNFDLAPNPTAAVSTVPKPAEAEVKAPALPQPTETAAIEPSSVPDPLAVPEQGRSIPVGPSEKAGVLAELPPPPVSDSAPVVEIAEAETRAEETPEPVAEANPASTDSTAPEALSFGAAEEPPAPVEQAAPEPTPEPAAIDVPPANEVAATPALLPNSQPLETLFDGDENSLVARAVGSAEGTRTANGGKTWAYRGHTDPGNGVWNLGTFSYQHGANSPEEADRKQLRRLMGQAKTLRHHATERGIELTLEEELNGIDLANQSPRAALSRGGYMDRLKQAHDMGLQGADAVLWARTRAFLDPDTERWNAPGLGNNVHSITADQERRRAAIARAIEASPIAPLPTQQAMTPPTPRREENTPTAEEEAIADYIISLDLPPV